MITQSRSQNPNQARLLILLGIVIASIGAVRLVLRYRDLILPPSASTVTKSGRSSAAVRSATVGAAKSSLAVAQMDVEDPSLAAADAFPGSDVALARTLRELNTTAPREAEARLLALLPEQRISVVTASLALAARHSSDEAISEAVQFCDQDPSYALEYGRALIATLGQTKDFRAALRFVRAEDIDGGLGENGSKWLNTLFTSWTKAAPAEAGEAARQAVAPGQSGEALQTVAAIWARTDPVAATNFAWQLPASPERDFTLAAALRTWSDTDPLAARAWTSRRL